jgi:hypothetical protein
MGNCVLHLWFMDSEAQNNEIIYSSEKYAGAITAVTDEHTVWKIKQEGNKKNYGELLQLPVVQMTKHILI